jgi:hypothetical protein
MTIGCAPAALALLATACCATTVHASIGLTVDSKTGKYAVSMSGTPWFTGLDYEYTSGGKVLSTADGSLKLDGATTGTGADAGGAYKATTLSWDGGKFVTEFRAYASMIVFSQSFPAGVQGTTRTPEDPYSARDDVSSAFPAFTSTAASSAAGYLAFTSDMTGSGAKHGTGGIGTLPVGVKGFGPTCFFTEDLSQSVVLSSYSQFMAASNGHRSGGMAFGVQGSVTAIPPEYEMSFVLVASSKGGVNNAFEQWGDKLLATYGKSRDVTYNDYSLNYLGYSTDNGAYYYYQTEGHTPGQRVQQPNADAPPGKNYEDTLIDVKTYADKEGIPYKYVLLDSWWYYQGVGGGVTNWIGRPDIFPHGNDYLRNKTGWPIMGHNRYWAVDNVYCNQNDGAYDFVVEKKGAGAGFNNFAWPTEQRFWDDLMYNSSKWGLFMYEQDWLDTEYDNVRHLNFNASAARTWLLQMGTAAERNHVTIQYCMSHCRHIMQSVEIPAVTNARASGDYHAGGDQWKPLGTTGIFAWAVGIAPTKDNFWSTDVQTGSAYKDFATIKESYNRLQSAVSTLSKGPVAPSDKIGRSDTSLIMKSCAADGKLLQGDKPAMVIDSAHVRKAFSPGGGGHHHGQECRITVTTPVKTTHSDAGYSAWKPMNKKSGGGYTEYSNDYCDCTGNGSCSKWAYHSKNDDFHACEQKCTQLNCTCFDWMGPSPAPSPAPAANHTATGPDGELWVTHTVLDGQTFGVAMGVQLNTDYTLSIASDMGLSAAKGYVHYEANATNAISYVIDLYPDLCLPASCLPAYAYLVQGASEALLIACTRARQGGTHHPFQGLQQVGLPAVCGGSRAAERLDAAGGAIEVGSRVERAFPLARVLDRRHRDFGVRNCGGARRGEDLCGVAGTQSYGARGGWLHYPARLGRVCARLVQVTHQGCLRHSVDTWRRRRGLTESGHTPQCMRTAQVSSMLPLHSTNYTYIYF